MKVGSQKTKLFKNTFLFIHHKKNNNKLRCRLNVKIFYSTELALLYGLEVCPMKISDLRSLDFVI